MCSKNVRQNPDLHQGFPFTPHLVSPHIWIAVKQFANNIFYKIMHPIRKRGNISLIVGNWNLVTVEWRAKKKKERRRGVRGRIKCGRMRVRTIDAVTYFLSSLPTALIHSDNFHRTQKYGRDHQAESRERTELWCSFQWTQFNPVLGCVEVCNRAGISFDNNSRGKK